MAVQKSNTYSELFATFSRQIPKAREKNIDVLKAEEEPVLPRCNMATDNRNGNDTSNKPLPCSTENQDPIWSCLLNQTVEVFPLFQWQGSHKNRKQFFRLIWILFSQTVRHSSRACIFEPCTMSKKHSAKHFSLVLCVSAAFCTAPGTAELTLVCPALTKWIREGKGL